MKKKLVNILSVLIILILMLLSVVSFMPRVIGYNGYYVDSFSMEKAIPFGALVLTKPIDFEAVKRGDVLTFERNDTTDHFTHRVVSINKEDQSFITKGDNNNTVDPSETPYKNVVGKVCYVIPFAGYVSMFLDTTVAKVVIGLLLIVYIAIEMELYRLKKGRN